MTDAPLIDHIRSCSGRLDPEPTGEQPVLPRMDGIGAVVFDIYGTLVISGSGDISLARAENRSPAMAASLGGAGFTVHQPGADWSGLLLSMIDRFRDKRQQEGVTCPEIRIEEVWKAVVHEAGMKGWLSGHGDLRMAIVDHECRVNPCWPMPGLEPLLAALKAGGRRLGIVSNAQFYTPLLFPALLGKTLVECGFDPGLSVWSYLEREGKPSVNLYRILQDKLRATGLSPDQTLYIGNDLRNDIRPASVLGFRTALFAGDRRSLRWRRDDPQCAEVRPDALVTELTQIGQILS